MSDKKKNHFVSQFYLKYFSFRTKNVFINGKKQQKYLINCFDKSRQSRSKPYTENIAYHNYFYDEVLEEGFSRVENQFKVIHDKIINDKSLIGLYDKQWNKLALYVSTQLLRTPEFRMWIENLHTGLNGILENKEVALELESPKKYHLDIIINRSDYLAEFLLKQRKWILLENKTKIPYWTSDSPVNFRPSRNHLEQFCDLPVGLKDMEFCFPLSPKLCLCLVERGREIQLKTIVEDEEMVLAQNENQVISSTQYIFSNKNNFNHANEVLKKYPKYKNLDRKRVRTFVKQNTLNI